MDTSSISRTAKGRALPSLSALKLWRYLDALPRDLTSEIHTTRGAIASANDLSPEYVSKPLSELVAAGVITRRKLSAGVAITVEKRPPDLDSPHVCPARSTRVSGALHTRVRRAGQCGAPYTISGAT